MSGPYVDFDKLARQITEDAVARALGIERHRRAWRCPLPEHHNNEDRDPSFDIYRYDGRLYAKCHTIDDAYTPVGLAAEVWGCGEQEAAVRLARRAGLRHLIERPQTKGSSDDSPEIYTYRDEDGELLFQVFRFPDGDKEFPRRSKDEDGNWQWSMDGTRTVPYRLPAVLDAISAGDPVYVVEGEGDVHAVESEGETATCPPRGTTSWESDFNEHLKGGEIRVVADDDPPGRTHARSVARSLKEVAESIELLKPAEGNDVEDHLDAGYTLDELKQLGGS